jgi:hypothetical protein
VDGSLVAFDDGAQAGWVCAAAELAPGVVVRRSVVVLDDYLVDLLQWQGDVAHEVALPLHGVDLVDDAGVPLSRPPMPIAGGDGLEDGFGFLDRTARVDARIERARARWVVAGSAGDSAAELRGWIHATPAAEWWTADAPDVPSRPGRVPMLLPRVLAARGSLLAVWSWRDAVDHVAMEGETLVVRRRDGRRDRHSPAAHEWRIELEPMDAPRERVVLGGLARATPAAAPVMPPPPPPPVALPASYTLGERHYRPSEVSWRDAGAPVAAVAIAMRSGRVLAITVTVEPSSRRFVPPDTVNPLDNEPAGINGDGVQLYVECGGVEGAWLLVPRVDSDAVWTSPITGWGTDLDVHARWQATNSGFRLDVQVALPAQCTTVAVDLLINETAPERARRRGQLVLSGADGEFVYLRGDRHDRHRLLRFTISDV